MIFLYFIFPLALIIFSFRLVENNDIKYVFCSLILPLIFFIVSFFMDYSRFKFPNLKGNLLLIVIFIFIPFVLSFIYFKINKNSKIIKSIYLITYFLSSIYLSLMLIFMFAKGSSFYSYTENTKNYFIIDEKVKEFDEYDVSYFPKDIDNLDVIKYSYQYNGGMFDSMYDIYLIVKYSSIDFENEFERVNSLEGFAMFDNGSFAKYDNYCYSDDCHLNYISFDRDNLEVVYAVTHREGSSFGLPSYLDKEVKFIKKENQEIS